MRTHEDSCLQGIVCRASKIFLGMAHAKHSTTSLKDRNEIGGNKIEMQLLDIGLVNPVAPIRLNIG